MSFVSMLLARRPSLSLLICLAVWVGVTVVLPDLLALLGRVLSPGKLLL